MFSVTKRIEQVKQPKGGYVPTSAFEKIKLDDIQPLFEEENISPALVGLTVDYLTRYMLDGNKTEAFKISLSGALQIKLVDKAKILLDQITELDDISIICACKLTGFDCCARSSVLAYKDIDTINPDSNTIENIRIMVKRSLAFFDKFGPVVESGMTFQGGYTKLVSSGDGDFTTKDTIWDFKVSKQRLQSKQTLQLLIYYLLGIHASKQRYEEITKLGIYNPRQNIVYLCNIADISEEAIKEVEEQVIGYNGFDEIILSQVIENIIEKESSNRKPTTAYKNEDMLTTTDLMAILKCSRNVIMRLYAKNGLPLKKIKNKYQISKEDFDKWYLGYQKQQKKEKILTTILLILVPLLFVLFYRFVLSQ